MSASNKEERKQGVLESVLDPRRIKHPVVSVIVTSFNYAPYIEACLDSIAAQSYRHFECVVVDDGSTDESAGDRRAIHRKRTRGGPVSPRAPRSERRPDGRLPDGPCAHGRQLRRIRRCRRSPIPATSSRPISRRTSTPPVRQPSRIRSCCRSRPDGQLLTGIQAMSGTPDLRASRSFDGHEWIFSPTEGP